MWLLIMLSLLTQGEVITYQQANQELDCMAQTIYFEARNQSAEGQQAVGEVVLSRVLSEKYPNTICGVIKQKGQFSWYKGKIPKMKNKKAKQKAYTKALQILTFQYKPLVPGAEFYHHIKISPKWSKAFVRVKRIEDHVFYKRKNTS